jgi:HlyD family secretion protein
MYADFNSIVRKGQVIARLDPSLIETRLEQQRASVVRSEADLERLRVNLQDAQQKLERARAMWDKALIPRTELETAEVNVKSAEAQIKSSEAALVQARANLRSEDVNLKHTVITSPIDGIVISRNVDPGQTVASSMNAPTLYVIAADLTKMQVVANIDEADVGRMRPNQSVRFRVDAYPNEEFTGTVEQVRLQPTVVQNVVVYSTVIAVPNPQLKLKPGMTANVSIEIARRSNVLRVPNAALRFRPTEEMFTVLNQPMPPELQRGGGRGGVPGLAGGRGRGDSAAQPSPAPAAQTAAQPQAGAPAGRAQGGTAPPSSAPAQPSASPAEQRGGGDSAEGRRGGAGGRGGFDPNMSPEERRRRMEERLASMTPEERERWQARMRERQAQGGESPAGARGREGASGAAAGTPTGRGGRDMSRGIAGGVAGGTAISSGATTIDSLFGPLPVVETTGRAWLYIDKQLKPLRLRLGISDGTYTELISGDLKESQEVVINMTTGLEAPQRPGQQGSQNPLMPPQRGGGPGRGR